MSLIQSTSSGVARPRESAEAASASDATLVYECFCGLGPSCPVFGLMNAEQRTACTRDKRRTAQSYYRNGVDW